MADFRIPSTYSEAVTAGYKGTLEQFRIDVKKTAESASIAETQASIATTKADEATALAKELGVNYANLPTIAVKGNDKGGVIVTCTDKNGSTSAEVEKGAKGDANTLTIESVTKGEEAAVTITGDAPNQRISFVLPKGDQGIQGEKGDKGDTGAQGEPGVESPIHALTVVTPTDATYALAPSIDTIQIAVSSALTLTNGFTDADKVGYLELILDITGEGAISADGTTVVIADALTSGNRNYCSVRFIGGVATLFVLEDCAIPAEA